MKYFISFIAGFVACIIFITSMLKKVENLIDKPSFKKFIVNFIKYLLYDNTPSYKSHRVTYYRKENE